jgi:hypothetical protein
MGRCAPEGAVPISWRLLLMLMLVTVALISSASGENCMQFTFKSVNANVFSYQHAWANDWGLA